MERRVRRSHDRDAALQLFVSSQRQKLDARALTVSTLDGMIFAGVGEIDESRPEQIATWEIRAGSGSFLLTSWGGRMTYDFGSGVRRIVRAHD